MKMLLSVLPLLSLCVPFLASAHDLGDKECHIALPGITFTRALNGAADHAKVSDGKLTLSSEAKGDNFRFPDGTLSNNTAPILLAHASIVNLHNGNPLSEEKQRNKSIPRL
jgi:hypothetical protein